MNVRELPGVSFTAQPPAVPDALPRMDIAGFAGFAASGPIDTPVAIEDITRFHDIFGEDLALAWNRERGEPLYAYLAPAVRGFFRNGGRRCWVVRLAGAARSNEFPIPGLLRPVAAGGYVGTCARARSEGSWSDALSVNASYTRVTVPPQMLILTAGRGMILNPEGGDRTALRSGDLLRVDFEASHRVVFLSIPLRPAGDTKAVEDGFWFQRAVPDAGWPPLQDASLLGCSDRSGAGSPPWSIPVLWWSASFQANGVPRFELGLPRSDASTVRPGAWLRLTFAAELPAAGSAELLLQVAQVRDAAVPLGSPPADGAAVSVYGSDAWWVLNPRRAWGEATGPLRAAVLNLELRVRYPEGEIRWIGDLGFTPAHPRYWGYLPSDLELFTRPERSGSPVGAVLRSDADHPRFALAGPPEARDSGAVYLPLGIPDVLREDFDQPALAQPSQNGALARNGLGNFSVALFLDPDLENASVSTLMAEAFHKRFQLRRSGDPGPLGLPLRGIHALLPIDEVSLISVPDAVHDGWEPANGEHPDTIAGPVLNEPVSGPEPAHFSLLWSEVPGATSYTVEESEDSRFSGGRVAWESRSVPDTVPSSVIERGGDCPRTLYFRVRGNRAGVRGPWSNTRRLKIRPGPFESCERVEVDPPELRIFQLQGTQRLTLEWSVPSPGVDGIDLEMSGEPGFASAQQLIAGAHPTPPGPQSFSVWPLRGITSYFRIGVRRGGVLSPWSATVWATPAQDAVLGAMALRDRDARTDDDLLSLHRAVLRLCAARGDVFATLSLPVHFRDDAALEYKERLATAMRMEEADRTLSFGALYHPWPVSRDGVGASAAALRRAPPDGAICGDIARRTLAGGAWLAPANRPLLGVLALEPPLADDAPRRFYDEQVNLLRQQPAGFLVLSADTLSDDADLRPIGVRRLLIVLRRLALREGNAYVFEPNDGAFSRRVQRQFERLLGGMFARGAFAGATPDQGFRVVTDNTVNPIDSIERGRFVIELRVAPSQPLAFLTVRLVQSGGELVLAETA
jgi:hypothetical protein